MKTPRRSYTDGPFGQIHFADTGIGEPILLFHQAPMTLRQFDSVYDLLAENGIRAIGVDMPGFGASDPTDFPPSIQDYAKIAPYLLDHLGIESSFILGHHTGSQVATEIALLIPDRIKGVILNGPAMFNEEIKKRGMDYVENHEKNFSASPDGAHLAAAYKNRMSYANDATNWDLTTRYVAEQFIGLGPLWYGHNAAFSYDQAASITRLKHPTLILTNTGDEIYNLAQEASQLRPDFSFTEIEGGGIDIVDEKPEEWTAAVTAFIQSFDAD